MTPSSTRLRIAVPLLSAIAALFAARQAAAAPPFTERRLTLPRHEWSFDVGLGFANNAYDRSPQPALNVGGVGSSFEFAVAPIDHLEIGARQGIRFSSNSANVDADLGARIFDRQTWGQLGEAHSFRFNDEPNIFSPPEVRIRGQLVDTKVFELGLEGRVYLPFRFAPFSPDTFFTTVFGLPLAFHAGRKVRIDTGAYVPVTAFSPLLALFSAPIDVWFQVTDRVWLGPQTGFTYRFERRNSFNNDLLSSSAFAFDVGFGLGIQVASFVDLKMSIYDPAINAPDNVQSVRAGFAAQFRIE